MKTMKTAKTLLFVMLLVLGFPAYVFASIAVVVHPDNMNLLDETEIRRIFLGKSRAFADGSEPIPFDQVIGSVARAEFVSKLLKKNEGQLNAYWARMLFSSKAIPPKVVINSEEMKKMIAGNPGAIGYIDAGLVDKTVKVIMILP